MWPALTWISPRASGTSRWITAGSSARPPLYATNAASTASIQAAIGSAARTSVSRSTRTSAIREACRPVAHRSTGGLEPAYARALALPRDHRAVRDGALPVLVLAPRRLRPVGVRRVAAHDRRAARRKRRLVR